MTTLRLGDAPVRLSIPIGEALTIVAPAGSSAYVADFSDFDPAASVSGTTQAFGPYTKTETVTVKCTAGAVDFSIAKVDASQAVVSRGGNFDATDAGTDWAGAPAALAVQAVLTAGTTTTVLVEVKDKAGTVTTAATITADTISQVLNNTVQLVGAAQYRLRRSTGTGTVNLLVQR